MLGMHDRELVDRDVLAAFEHVDADDVGADRADARRDETERARSVGKPDAHDQTNAIVARGRVPGRGHAGQGTAPRSSTRRALATRRSHSVLP